MEEYYEYEELASTPEEVLQFCVFPSLIGITWKIGSLLVCSCIFKFATQTVALPGILFHSISLILGFVAMFLTIHMENICHFFLFLLIVYVLLFSLHYCNVKKYGANIEYFVGIGCILYLLCCEFLFTNPGMWSQSRGLFMVGAMKIISISFDLQHNSRMLKLIEYFGYLCSPANCLFGPWIPYSEYSAVWKDPCKTNALRWIKRLIIILVAAAFFLTISNCWAVYFVPDDSYKWFVGYRQAHAFRTSHYFISFVSEALMISAGYCDDKHKSQGTWGYQITNLIDIEFPTSLVSVVISWNIPMHRFLKKYVYKAFLQMGHFKAMFVTYLVSSLLHGFNIEIATVLLTIGLYSYIQLKFQEKLSFDLNACLKVRPCKSCSHRYKRKNILVQLGLGLFSLLTICNLIYLGVLMDSIGDLNNPSIYSKWENLDFLSHWIMFAIHIYTII